MSVAMNVVKYCRKRIRAWPAPSASRMPSAIPVLSAALMIGVAALPACGFRLAGSEPLSAVLARPYLEFKDPYTDFSREFERQLKIAGAKLQPVREGATATIVVTKDLVKQSTLAVSATNIPTEYELTYTVTFAVRGAEKDLKDSKDSKDSKYSKYLLAPQTIELSKDYSFVETALLAKEHEEDILRTQMARDLVAIAMHRLTSLK
jgi:LPS-assembly lipoprotein